MKQKPDFWNRVGEYIVKVDLNGNVMLAYRMSNPDDTYLLSEKVTLDAAKMRSYRKTFSRVLVPVEKSKIAAMFK